MLLLCFLLLAGSVSKADDGGYTITDYDVKAILHPDNTIDVTERIGVLFTEERHGIYRNIPLEMTVVRDFSRKQDNALEILSRIKEKAFLSMTFCEKPNPENCIPIYAYNPYPYEISGDFLCELMLWDQDSCHECSVCIFYNFICNLIRFFFIFLC